MKHLCLILLICTTVISVVTLVTGCHATKDKKYRNGLELADNGHYYEAIEEFAACISAEPDFSEAWNNYGALSILTGQYLPAEGHLDRSIELDAMFPVAYNNRGVTYVYQGHFEKAIDDFNAALVLAPDYTDASENLSYIQNLQYESKGIDPSNICVYTSYYNGEHDYQTAFSLAIGQPYDTPILLVHGFQVTEHNLDWTWNSMVESLAARDIGSEYDWLDYTSDITGEEYRVKRIAGNCYTLYISDYTHDISLGTSGDLREYSRSIAEEIKVIKMYEGIDRIDVVAHSLGGLVVRSYIEAEDFTDNPYQVTFGGDIRNLLMLGTPNKGTYYPEPFYDVLDWTSVQQMGVGSDFLTEINKGVSGREKGVTYFAVAGNAYVCGDKMNDPLAEVICALSGEMDNDGVVPVTSVQLSKQGEKEEIAPSRWYVTALTHLDLSDYPGALMVKKFLNNDLY